MKKLILFLLICFSSYAQNNMFNNSGNPSSDKGGGMSSLSKNVQIPIYTIKENGVELPIYLSYDNSGVKPNSTPSVVGLNWSLNAGGQINRHVNHLPDDAYSLPTSNYIIDAHTIKGYIFDFDESKSSLLSDSEYNPDNYTNDQYFNNGLTDSSIGVLLTSQELAHDKILKSNVNEFFDTASDFYFMNVSDGSFLNFYYQRNSNLEIIQDNGNIQYEIEPDYNNLKNSNNTNDEVYSITNNNAIQYNFIKGPLKDKAYAFNQEIPTSDFNMPSYSDYYLKELKNLKDESVIQIEYEINTKNKYELQSSVSANYEGNNNQYRFIKSFSEKVMIVPENEFVPSSISSSKIRVEFDYLDFTYQQLIPFYNPDTEQMGHYSTENVKLLEKIKIYDQNDIKLKEIELEYDAFDNYQGKPVLSKISERKYDNPKEEIFAFEYYINPNYNVGEFPGVLSDPYGYLNYSEQNADDLGYLDVENDFFPIDNDVIITMSRFNPSTGRFQTSHDTPTYTLDYYTDSTNFFRNLTTVTFGFYSLNAGVQALEGISKMPILESAKTGSLKTMYNLQKGGGVTYEYKLNKANNRYYGGLLVSDIKSFNDDLTIEEHIKYEYLNPQQTGVDLTNLEYYFSSENMYEPSNVSEQIITYHNTLVRFDEPEQLYDTYFDDVIPNYSSDLFMNLNQMQSISSGYNFEEVKRIKVNPNDTLENIGYTIKKYEPALSLNGLGKNLKEETVFDKDDNVLKRTTFEHDYFIKTTSNQHILDFKIANLTKAFQNTEWIVFRDDAENITEFLENLNHPDNHLYYQSLNDYLQVSQNKFIPENCTQQNLSTCYNAFWGEFPNRLSFDFVNGYFYEGPSPSNMKESESKIITMNSVRTKATNQNYNYDNNGLTETETTTIYNTDNNGHPNPFEPIEIESTNLVTGESSKSYIKYVKDYGNTENIENVFPIFKYINPVFETASFKNLTNGESLLMDSKLIFYNENGMPKDLYSKNKFMGNSVIEQNDFEFTIPNNDASFVINNSLKLLSTNFYDHQNRLYAIQDHINKTLEYFTLSDYTLTPTASFSSYHTNNTAIPFQQMDKFMGYTSFEYEYDNSDVIQIEEALSGNFVYAGNSPFVLDFVEAGSTIEYWYFDGSQWNHTEEIIHTSGSVSIPMNDKVYLDEVRYYPSGYMSTTRTFDKVYGLNFTNNPQGDLIRIRFKDNGRTKIIVNEFDEIISVNKTNLKN